MLATREQGKRITLVHPAGADVSGKGTPASLIMAFAHAAFRSLAGSLPPVDLLARISELIRNANKSHRYATCFYAELDPATRTLWYVNAGHLPPAIVRGDETIELKVGGSVLGLLPGTTFEQGEVTLKPGDVLAIYSDGVSEAQSVTDANSVPKGWWPASALCARRRHRRSSAFSNSLFSGSPPVALSATIARP